MPFVFERVIKMSEKELDKVGSEKMMEILNDYPELREQYEKEELKEHIEIVSKYLQKINQLNQ